MTAQNYFLNSFLAIFQRNKIHKTVGIKVLLTIFASQPDSNFVLLDLGPGSPKTSRSRVARFLISSL
jgi:hypothetical protein